jgi:integrase
VEETIVEVSIKNSPTGNRMLVKPYPKDNEPRTMGLPPELITQLGAHITEHGLRSGDLLFATRQGTPFSRNTFRTRVWRPAVAASGVDFEVRVHDLRHAHASWLLAGGSDLKSVMDRMGHAQITTTQKYLHTLPARTLYRTRTAQGSGESFHQTRGSSDRLVPQAHHRARMDTKLGKGREPAPTTYTDS